MDSEPMDVEESGGSSGGFDWSTPFDELDAEDESSASYGGRDAMLFTIDVSKSMFLPSEGNQGELALEKTLKAVRQAIIQKSWSSPQDFVGILLFNTAKKEGTSFEHIYLYADLQNPGAEVIKQVDKLIEKAKSRAKIEKEFGIVEKCSIADLFWATNTLFTKVTGVKLNTRRVLLFTAEDDPHRGDQNAANAAKQKALDISENKVTITVFSLSTVGRVFSGEKFWNGVQEVGAAVDEPPKLVTPATQWEDLEVQIRKRAGNKRALARLPLTLDGVEFFVGVYSLVLTATKPTAVKLAKDTLQPAAPETIMMETCGGGVLMPMEIKKYMKFAGRELFFSNEEVEQMKRFGPPGLKVIGLMPQHFLKERHHLRTAQFLYPDETVVKGSTRLFIALQQKCLEKQLLILCQYIPREAISPKYVALIPCDEIVDELNQQLQPPGFTLNFLPFADDFRSKLPLYREAPVANSEMIDVAKKLVNALDRPDFYIESIANPALQTHFLNIEALALGYTEEERTERQPKDYTVPHWQGISKKTRGIVPEFLNLVYAPGYDPEAAAKKRTYEKSDEEKPVKIKKEIDGSLSEQINAAAENGTLKKFTVANLKEYCQQHKIKSEGTKKDDLMAAIETHLAGNN